MTDLAVVVPSRGRPEQCGRLVDQILATAGVPTSVVVAVDADDPTLSRYDTLRSKATMTVLARQRGHVAAINAGATIALRALPRAIAKLDDDHWPLTPDWGAVMLTALDDMGGGIVYGNDLLQGHRLPTAPALSTAVVKALGWMGPPVLRHMFVDDFWRDLGRGAGRLRYLPEVMIEHRHPAVDKTPMDEGYERVGTQDLFDDDQAAYLKYVADPDGLAYAVESTMEALSR
jgi:hypothetical protein